MQTYYALVHQEGNSSFGISFPDIPNCFSAADAEDDILGQAQEALALYVSDLLQLPSVRSLESLRRDSEVIADLQAGAFLIAVPLIVMDKKSRFNVMLDKSLVAEIDRVSKTVGVNRSEFIAHTMRRRLETELGAVFIHRSGGRQVGTGAFVATSASKVLADPKPSKAAKTAAASALTQSKPKETTSAKAATAASKVLKDPKASKDAKSAAASALTQKAKKK